MSKVGTGVDKEVVEAAEAASAPHEDAGTIPSDPEQRPKWSSAYEDTPQTLDQLEKFPETVKFGPIQVEVFDLSKKDDVVALNVKLAMTEPELAPGIIVKHIKEEFSETTGNFITLIRYQRVYYKHRSI